MNYGYVRVSTKDQVVDRQVNDVLKFGVEQKNIFIDYESGKDFCRGGYRRLFKKLKEDDVLFIKSIDRLGRNYDMIIEEWRKITKVKKCAIVVLDMPLLDTRKNNSVSSLLSSFISDLVLQILSFVAQTERETILQRQKDGIAAAKLRGVKFGRPRIKNPVGLKKVLKMYIKREITNVVAAEMLKLSRGTFYHRLNEYKEKKLVN